MFKSIPPVTAASIVSKTIFPSNALIVFAVGDIIGAFASVSSEVPPIVCYIEPKLVIFIAPIDPKVILPA